MMEKIFMQIEFIIYGTDTAERKERKEREEKREIPLITNTSEC